MDLYLMKRPDGDRVGYDEWDSCVVAAESVDHAQYIHPGGYAWGSHYWGESAAEGWNEPSAIVVTRIGTAAEGVEPGVVCASFNAG